MLSVKQIKAAFVEYLPRKYPMMWIVYYVVDNKHLKCFFIIFMREYGIKLNGEKRNGGGYLNLFVIWSAK